MSANIVLKGASYYVEVLDDNGRVVDEAGPFDEEHEADEVALRIEASYG